jgi:hypothetical protein
MKSRSDVIETRADAIGLTPDVGFRPSTSIEGVSIASLPWFRAYHGV